MVGTVLDPRCKFSWYSCNRKHFPNALVKKYGCAVKHIWEASYKPEPRPSSDAEAPNNSTKPQDLIASQMKRAKLDKRDELLYLDESIVGPNEDSVKDGVLNWWKARSHIFLNMSKMAHDYLSVSGTGEPIERFFSHGSDILSARRQSMHAETIRRCMCLQGWLKTRNEEEFKTSVAEALADKVFTLV